jgi:hypothetical protein
MQLYDIQPTEDLTQGVDQHEEHVSVPCPDQPHLFTERVAGFVIRKPCNWDYAYANGLPTLAEKLLCGHMKDFRCMWQ